MQIPPANARSDGAEDSALLLRPSSGQRGLAKESNGSSAGPRISVVVATYNSVSTVQRCINSVVGQDYPHVELFVVDGASTDGTVEILQANTRTVAWSSAPDRGVFQAWNKALRQAQGDWICFLGADDYFWSLQVLSEMAPRLDSAYTDGVHIVYGQVGAITQTGDLRRLIGLPWEAVRDRMQWEMCIPHPGMFHHRTLFERYGLFDESYRVAGDYDFLMRELRDGVARFVPEVITTAFQDGGISNSPELALTALREMAQVRRRYNLRAPFAKRISATYVKIILSILLSHTLGHGVARRVKGLYRRTRSLIG